MTRRFFIFLLFAGIVYCAPGCFPYLYKDRPAVSGEVFDSKTGAPLAGALIDLKSTKWNDESPPDLVSKYPATAGTSTSTSGDGRFSLPPLQHWGLALPFMPPFEPWQLNVTREGYTSVAIKLDRSVERDGAQDLGRIDLQPLPSTAP